MTTAYKFKATFTKAGVATTPSSAATIKVVDSADNILVAAATATTALTNLAGCYIYSYSGADGLDLIGRFTTTDTTMDQIDLDSYTALEIHDILMDTGTTIPALLGSLGGALSLIYTVYVAGVVKEGATVKLYSDSGRTSLITTKVSNVLGVCTFSNLVAGTYYLTVQMSGYEDLLDSEVVA